MKLWGSNSTRLNIVVGAIGEGPLELVDDQALALDTGGALGE